MDMRQLYEMLLETLPDIVYQVDPEGHFQYLNDTIHKLGYTPEELIGKHYSILFHREDLEKIQRSVVLDKVEGSVTGEKDAPLLFDERRTGKRITKKLPVRLVPKHSGEDFPDGESLCEGEVLSFGFYSDNDAGEKFFNGSIGLIRDISDTKRTEKALVHAEKHYKLLIENISDIITILANDGTILFKSNSVTKNMGYDPVDLIGENELEYVHPDDRLYLTDIIEERGDGALRGHHDGFRFRHRDGSWRFMELDYSRIMDVNNHTMCFIVNSRDITRRIEIEEQLRIAKEEAEAASMIKSSFITNMSHEFRTPLNVIIGYCQLISVYEKEKVGEKVMEYVKDINESALSILAMVNNILQLSKNESERITITKKPFDLNHMAGTLLRALKRRFDAKHIVPRISLNEERGSLNGDEIKLRQVIYHLLTNAVNFTESNSEVGVDLSVVNDTAVITVWDHGCGIDNNDIEKIFEPFEKSGNRLFDSPAGAGLGLSIARRIVELHGGSISVESSPGNGSRFIVTIPGWVSDVSKKK